MPVEKIIETCKLSYQSECIHSSSDEIDKVQCARVAGNDANCHFCTGRVPEGAYVVFFPCGHWVERTCYYLQQAAGVQVKCGYKCSKDSRDFHRSSELMSEEVRALNELTSIMMSDVQQHDVAEDELTDVEDLLERDEELANMKHSQPTCDSPSDIDSVYEGDNEDAGGGHHAKAARRRRSIMERAVDQIVSAEEQPQVAEEEVPGHFFPPIPEDEEDFGLNSGLTLSQRMFNLPRSRRYL